MPVEGYPAIVGFVDRLAKSRQSAQHWRWKIFQPMNHNCHGARVVASLSGWHTGYVPALHNSPGFIDEEMIPDIGEPALEVPAADFVYK